MRCFLTRLAALAAFASGAAGALAAPPRPDPDHGSLQLAPGFGALVVADNLGKLRFVAAAPNGDLYVKTSDGGIVALRDTNGDGKADVTERFGSGGGTGIAVRDGALYHSTDEAVFRYRLAGGALVPKGEPETIVSGLPRGREHTSKSFTFDDAGRLYVEVGSPNNAYAEPDRRKGAKGKDPTEFLKTHGGVWRFEPAKTGQKQADGVHVTTGHRHILALAWNPAAQALFAVQHGRDQLGDVDPDHYTADDNAELPAEEMHVLREGTNLGWPFTYWDPVRKARMLNPEHGGDKEKRAEPGKYPDPVLAFPAHWAPMQMAFYGGTQFPAKYRGGAFIAFHGSWNRAPKPQRGFKVVFVPFDAQGKPKGDYETFADGFAGVLEFTDVNSARHRPCGLAVGPDGSLYVADSVKGRVWRIVYTGPTESSDARRSAANGAPAGGRGADLYRDACAACHMADGTGVPRMQPALRDYAIVAGDPAALVRVVSEGPDQVLPLERPRYTMTMPGFGHLSDADMADVLSYVREAFAGAPPITTADVAAARATP
jgi:glucose/arabinose dehydrogenase